MSAKMAQSPRWRRNIILKRGKASRTPGKLKGDHCQTNPVKRFFASSPKAYKHKDYEKWHDEFKRLNLGGKS
jgi:hypothetical protein